MYGMTYAYIQTELACVLHINVGLGPIIACHYLVPNFLYLQSSASPTTHTHTHAQSFTEELRQQTPPELSGNNSVFWNHYRDVFVCETYLKKTT